MHGPSVTSGYVVADNGVKIKFSDSFSVSPFAGLAGNITFIETFSDIDFNVRVGCDLNYEFAMLGVRYEYVTGVVANTNGDVMLNGRVGFWSVFDNAGADINIGVMKLYDTVMYQVGIGAKVWF